MLVLAHIEAELSRALLGRAAAKLRMIAVEQARGFGGELGRPYAARDLWRSRVSYHQATLMLFGIMIRHSQWHRAMHRAAMRAA